MATTENKPFHHERQHDPDRCEAFIPGSTPIPVDEYQSNRCSHRKGHTSTHAADFHFWRDESNPKTPEALDYDWGEDPTAQDVIDALRITLLAKQDSLEVEKLVRCLVDFAPETESNRGISLLMRLISEATLKVQMISHDPVRRTDHGQ